jgi:hypothetical protein
MKKKPTPQEKTLPLILTPKDEEILRAVYEYRFVTAQDITMLLYSKGSLTYVRSRLAKLSGGRDHAERQYLYRFQLPTGKTGNREKVFTLGSLGRETLESLGLKVDWYFRPYKTDRLSRSHLVHHLLLTRFVVAALHYTNNNLHIHLLQTQLCHELSRLAALTAVGKDGTTAPVIPDAWLLFERQADRARFPVLFEAERGMLSQERFKIHVRSRLEFVLSGDYTAVFETPAVIIAYVTTGEVAQYAESRRKAMTIWTHELLTELGLQTWAAIFRFTAVAFDTLYDHSQRIFEQPVWYAPDSPVPIPLFGA